MVVYVYGVKPIEVKFRPQPQQVIRLLILPSMCVYVCACVCACLCACVSAAYHPLILADSYETSYGDSSTSCMVCMTKK